MWLDGIDVCQTHTHIHTYRCMHAYVMHKSEIGGNQMWASYSSIYIAIPPDPLACRLQLLIVSGHAHFLDASNLLHVQKLIVFNCFFAFTVKISDFIHKCQLAGEIGIVKEILLFLLRKCN